MDNTAKLATYRIHKTKKKKPNTYIIVTDMEGNIRVYRLPKGRGTDQWK
jgi:hypothetical protein